MVYLIDPQKATEKECWFYCYTKCKGVAYPLYGIPW
jgi:hypothetical protein